MPRDDFLTENRKFARPIEALVPKNFFSADSLTRFRRPDKNSEETNNSINGIDRREYRQSVATARTKQRNNLEPQHGVTPCRIDSALQNGLSALGYVPQWALPTDCVHWEYQQEPLIAYNESANDDWNLYCNDTSNAPKEIDGNLLLRGVSDLYRHIQTAYQSALTIPKLSLVDQSKESLVLPAEYIGTNPLLSPDYPKGLSLADCPWWERHCPTALIPLANCESIVNEDPTTRKEEHEDRKSNTNDLPYDFSIAKSSSSNRETDPKLLTLHTGRTGEKVSRPKLNSCWTLGKLGETKKLDVEEGLVKDERNTETRSYLSAGHFPSSYWEESEMSGQYPGHSRPPVGTPPPQTVWNHLTMAQSQGKGGANVRVGMSGSNGGGGGGGGGGVGNNNGGGGGGGGGGGSGGGGGGSSGSSGNGNGAGGVGVGGGPTVHESLSRSAYERVQPDLTYLLSEVSGLNMHPTGLSGASLNPAGFYSHPSMTRAAASHLTSQLTPQLAHTQAPPTWHTPTVPSKNVTAPNAPGNPLYSLQMLVDNRQNQSQYRNSPGLQSTLDLSATSEMAENYSRMTQDIPISLTARNVDKGSRNGNIISPPIPLNGETSSDSGISSSVPTPNSVGEAVSLSTKEALTTPKITVKNFESNLKGVANLHDKMKEISVENFAQKVINLPPSVTIERVVASEKKESEQPVKMKDSLSVIAQVPRNVLPVIVNLTSRMDNKDAADSPMRESSSERERKIDESVRSPKNLGKRGKKGVDSLLEKLEGGNKKLGNSENIGSVIVAPPLEEKDSSSVKSMSPERQKSKSPTREDDVVSPAFSNDDSNDNTKQRRKRKLEKPVRLSKDSKTELEDMELEPTEPREPRTCCEPVSEQPPSKSSPNPPSSAAAAAAAAPTVPTVPTVNLQTRSEVRSTEEDDDDHREKIKSRVEEKQVATAAAATTALTTGAAVMTVEGSEGGKIEENERIKRRRSSEGPSTNQTPTNQRTRRRSSDDATEFSKVTSPKGSSSSSNNNNANPFNEVESELEKMFAGIVEEEVDSKDVSKSESMGDLKKKKKKKKEEEEEEEEEADEEEEENPLKREKEGGGPEGKASSKALNLNLTDVTSTVETATKQPAKKAGKKGKVRGGKRKMSRNSDNAFVATIEDVAATKDNKKRRGSKGSKKLVPETPSKRTRKNFKSDGLREMAYDSGSNASSIRSRGPVVHVEGPRDSPLSVQVVNAPREEEEEKSKEKRKSVGNGNAARSKRLGHQNDLDYRGKVSRAGLFSSTLSSRYDAHTTDSTWVCVFCKQGPHSVVPGDPARPHPNLAGPHIAPGTYTVPAGVLSDLFGPYLIGKERLEEGILSADEQEITTEQKKGGKNKRSLRYAGLADQFSAKMGKKKRNSVESLVTGALTGMTMLPGEEQRWEVWLHEQCALWAAGVYMAGGRVTGLQEAVWDSTKSICGSCGLTGANIGCVKRGCKAVTHYPCALTKGWLLDTSQYIPKCNLHRVT